MGIYICYALLTSPTIRCSNPYVVTMLTLEISLIYVCAVILIMGDWRCSVQVEK